MDKKHFVNVMNRAAHVYDIELTKRKLDVYWELLKDYSNDQFSKSMTYIIRSSNFFPRPAQIIKSIEPAPISIEDKALEQANSIIEHVKAYGSSFFPPINDPITKHLMTRRWPYQNWAANLIESEEQWWVKQFCEAYRAFNNTEGVKKIEAPKEIREIANNLFESAN